MRHQHGWLFDELPELAAEIVTRIRVGRYVVDEEHLTGRPEGELRAVAIYRLSDHGLIDRVRILR
jgi:hypothetical protein